MKTRYILISALALMAVLLSACGLASTVANPAPPQRSISVSGSGQAYLTPDFAYIYIGVHSEKPSASEAVSENNANTQKVITALRNFGVDAKDIRTTNFSIYPSQQYGPDLPSTPAGERVGSVDVTEADLATAPQHGLHHPSIVQRR